MALTYDTNFGKYYSRIRGIFITHLSPIIRPDKKEIRSLNNNTLDLNIVFSDGSRLRGMETFSVSRNQVKAIRYGYEYERPNGFFFHYEMESDEQIDDPELLLSIDQLVKRIDKPCCHLHVGARKETADQLGFFPEELREHGGPHYPTFPVSLEFVLAIIIVNYFPHQTNILENLSIEKFIN